MERKIQIFPQIQKSWSSTNQISDSQLHIEVLTTQGDFSGTFKFFRHLYHSERSNIQRVEPGMNEVLLVLPNLTVMMTEV